LNWQKKSDQFTRKGKFSKKGGKQFDQQKKLTKSLKKEAERLRLNLSLRRKLAFGEALKKTGTSFFGRPRRGSAPAGRKKRAPCAPQVHKGSVIFELSCRLCGSQGFAPPSWGRASSLGDLCPCYWAWLRTLWASFLLHEAWTEDKKLSSNQASQIQKEVLILLCLRKKTKLQIQNYKCQTNSKFKILKK
jgi:hypothetical protein